jgi:hypothetical protein
VDQSERILAIARDRLPDAEFVLGDALRLPFTANSSERVFTGHFYGHLGPDERGAFIHQALRLAPELIVVDSALRPDHEPEERQERVLNDGSQFEVYKRYFNAHALADELGGGTVLHANRWFVAVCVRRSPTDAAPAPQSVAF